MVHRSDRQILLSCAHGEHRAPTTRIHWNYFSANVGFDSTLVGRESYLRRVAEHDIFRHLSSSGADSPFFVIGHCAAAPDCSDIGGGLGRQDLDPRVHFRGRLATLNILPRQQACARAACRRSDVAPLSGELEWEELDIFSTWCHPAVA